MFSVKKNMTNTCYPRIQKIVNKNIIHPSFTSLLSFTLAKISFTLGWTIHPVKKHCPR